MISFVNRPMIDTIGDIKTNLKPISIQYFINNIKFTPYDFLSQKLLKESKFDSKVSLIKRSYQLFGNPFRRFALVTFT